MLNYYDSKKEKKKYKPPEDSTLQHTAQKENFAIFLLRSILSITSSSSLRSHIPINLRNDIELAAMQSIHCIKDVQRIRMINNKDKKHREPK